MIATQTFDAFPEFGNTATKTKPDDAKYSAGMQEADVLPAEWLNWFWSHSSKGVSDLNTGVESIEKEINSVLTNQGITPSADNNGQLLQALLAIKNAAVLAAHPVGSLYWSSQSTNPSSLFGGTWTQIKDKFVWAKGDNDTVNATGGEKTHALTVEEMPSHNHSASSGTESTAHSHYINLNTGDGGVDHTHTGYTGSMNRNQSHHHKIGYNTTGTTGGFGMYVTTQLLGYGDYLSEDANIDHEHSVQTYGASAYLHSHSVTGYTGNESANHSHTITVNANGSGTAHNNMPPYIVKYCWERTA